MIEELIVGLAVFGFEFGLLYGMGALKGWGVRAYISALFPTAAETATGGACNLPREQGPVPMGEG